MSKLTEGEQGTSRKQQWRQLILRRRLPEETGSRLVTDREKHTPSLSAQSPMFGKEEGCIGARLRPGWGALELEEHQ